MSRKLFHLSTACELDILHINGFYKSSNSYPKSFVITLQMPTCTYVLYNCIARSVMCEMTHFDSEILKRDRLSELIYFVKMGHNTNKTQLFNWQNTLHCIYLPRCLIHRGGDKIAAISHRIFSNAFFNEKLWISLNISLKFIPKVRLNNIPTLVQIMAWYRPGDKPLSEPTMVSLLTHVCVTRPQWINYTAK